MRSMPLPIVSQTRPGAYADSVVLMQLQRALAALPGVEEAGVVMGTPANRALLEASDLLAPELAAAGESDLLIALRCNDEEAGRVALAQVDALLMRRGGGSGGDDEEYRPRTLAAAAQMAPDAGWVLISVPGRYAAAVAHEALGLGKHLFLYSDNVSAADEVTLKRAAAARGLLVMGPDCGTAIVGGVGLGFANRVRRGPIGLVGASGTGLQLVSARIHQLGGGVSHALGTGGRDLSETVGAISALQSLELLRRDPATHVIVLISKPPAPAVAKSLLRAARRAGKPVVVCFVGYQPEAPAEQGGMLTFAPTLDAAAEAAVALAARDAAPPASIPATGSGFLRALYSGGTLAYEAQLILRDRLPGVWSNAPLDKTWRLENALVSREHTVLDLGEDEFTVGRLHPMLDNELRIKRLLHEAADPATGALLLDVVLGDGAHPNPAAEIAPAIVQARALAANAGRTLPVVIALVGTDADPQGMDQQADALRAAGANVSLRHAEAVEAAAAAVSAAPLWPPPVALEALNQPFSALNVGLDSFAQSLRDQGAAVLALDWRPPAAANERLAGILARMKTTTTSDARAEGR